jgi:2,3-bisphosphoglycerate-dependent phosphoglycerate mutase
MSIDINTDKKIAKLVLVRHGESEYNAKDLWTGWLDVPLTEKGREEARRAGEEIKDIKIDAVFVSDLIRSKQTWEEIAKVLGLEKLEATEAWEIKERSYGDLAGQNKFEVKKKYGDEQWLKWRRGWDEKIPNGETLKDVYNRCVPFFQEKVLPLLKSGKNVLLSDHGNSFRALVKYLDKIEDSEIYKLEIPTGTVYIYDFDSEGNILKKEIRADK